MKRGSLGLVSFFLRIGLAVVFLYAAVSSFLDPSSWFGFFPSWLANSSYISFLLTGFGVYQVVLSLWLLSGKKTYYASVLSSLTLFFIILFNIRILDVVFRDVAIMLSAIALAILSRGDEK